MRKQVLTLLAIVFFLSVTAFATTDDKEAERAICPITKVGKDCLTCHTVSAGKFMLRDFPPDNHLIYPSNSIRIKGWEDGNLYGYYALRNIDPDDVNKYFDYLRIKKVRRAVIEIFSPGGGLFQAQKIVSLMGEWQGQGNILETRTDGAAFSAGFYIFVAGTPGHRYVHPYAEMMWHELQALTGYGLVIDTPSTSEEKARVLRYLQNNRNTWLATKGKLTKDELDQKVKNREWWITGKQAIEYGFADKFISNSKGDR